MTGTTIEIPHGDTVVPVPVPAAVTIEFVAPLAVPARDGVVDIGKVLTSVLRAKHEAMRVATRVLVVIDDHTRVTPVRDLLPPVLGAARDAGTPVEILVAGGSHRPMTREEKRDKVGPSVLDEVPVFDHEWGDGNAFVHLGQLALDSTGPVELHLNKRACEPGTFLVAMGNIVPHRVVGFSGGYKILLPGLATSVTMNQIHYTSARFPSETILGVARNPVRDMVNAVHQHRPIDCLINTVLDRASTLVSLCAGDPIAAQYQGAAVARAIYGVPVLRPAGVVIADAVPESVDFWVCAKAVTNCKAFVERGGHLIVFAPCTEGWAPGHEHVLFKHGYHNPGTIDTMVQTGEIDPAHLVEASHLSHVGEVQAHCTVHLVSDSLEKNKAGSMGFDVVRTTEVADLLASTCRPAGTRVTVVSRGSEILPVLAAKTI